MSEESSQDQEKTEKPEKLDLGLSSLLDGVNPGLKESLSDAGSLSEVLKRSVELSEAASAPQQSAPDSEKKSEEKTEAPIKPEAQPVVQEPLKADQPQKLEDSTDEYKRLAEKKDWQELSKICEKKLAESSDEDKPAKLWWIKAQHEMSSIPIGILAPSLNLVAKELASDKALNGAVCRELLLSFARHLISNADYEFALLFLRYLLDGAADGRPGISSLINEFEKKLKSESKFQATEEFQRELDELKKRHKLNLHSQIFDKLEPEKAAALTKQKTEEVKAKQPEKRRSYRTAAVLLASILLIISAAVLYGPALLNRLTKAEDSQYKPALEYNASLTEQNLIEPVPERVAGLNHIDAVFYEVSNTSPASSDKPLPAEASSPAVTSLPNTAPAAEQLGTIPVNVSPKLPKVSEMPNRSAEELKRAAERESVNTSYPVERERRYEEPEVSSEQIPEIDFPPYRSNKRRDGYGSESRRSPNDPNYIVIARTKVMKEPSYYADQAADLSIGDRVLVEEQLGKWLRIRAKNGKPGYILAQDADRLP